jgi:phenylalanine-4-hydroxylase
MARSPALSEEYAELPALPAGVFTAALRKPPHLGDDWLEPCQRAYSAEENRIWDELYARQMELLPGRAASAFLAGTTRLAPA